MSARSVWRAMYFGWQKRCPACGEGTLYKGYLQVRRTCPVCGELLHHHRVGWLPALLTVLLAAQMIIFGLVMVEVVFSPPIWAHWGLWPALTAAACLWLLPRIKGMLLGLQWATGMHGFGQRTS
ncbi:MAG: DUF983 domain-containing protein [Pseudomonadota bacterium]